MRCLTASCGDSRAPVGPRRDARTCGLTAGTWRGWNVRSAGGTTRLDDLRLIISGSHTHPGCSVCYSGPPWTLRLVLELDREARHIVVTAPAVALAPNT